MSFGQTAIDGFNYASPDTVLTHSVEGDKSLLTITQNTGDKKEGASALEVFAKIGAYHEWGSYATFGNKNPDEVQEDWSLSDSISIWIKVKNAPTVPQNLVFRIQIADKPTASDPSEEYIYENATVLDAATDWIHLKVPLIERNQPGTDIPDSTGFILVPTSWGGFTYNNKVLDRTKIDHWTIGIITSGYTAGVNLPADSVTVMFDDFARFGTRAVPVIIFNGKDFNAPVTQSWAWGAGSSVAVLPDSGVVAKSNAVKFVESSEWGGWGGWGVDMTSTNMMGSWPVDTFHVTIKAGAGGDDTLRAQFESANGKRAIKFAVTRDNAWHDYAFALRDMLFDDGKPDFDTSAVIKFGIMENGHNATGGQIDYFTNIWTGNPVFDVISPDAPTGVSAITGEVYQNLILWTDLTNESGTEKYNVYYGSNAWTSIDDPSITDIYDATNLFNLPHGTQLQTHLLRTPLTDKQVTYYYGVVAKDESGNLSDPTLSGAVTNTGRGVPVIAMQPLSFAADGDLSEWTTAKVTPFNLSINGGAHVNTNGTIDNDADLSVKAYFALDANYLYVAYDVTDNKVSVDTLVNSYESDSPDLYIGLYDWVGKFHSGLKSGATPDYHLRFSQNKIILDNNGKTITYPNANYYWAEKPIDPGYVVEAKIPLSVLADSLGGSAAVFTPALGMRIPMDIVVNDRDDKTVADRRDGMLIYSEMNPSDASWQDMWRWTYTWTSDQTLGVQNGTTGHVVSYDLDQNYPNPFNPSTQITFSLAKAGITTLKVYDVLGKVVATLVDGYQEAGPHTISFNAGRNISSGMYFYKIESGSFSSVKKMMLIK